MLAEIKKALSDFSSGFAEAMAQSVASIRALLASIMRKQQEQQSQEKGGSKASGGENSSREKPPAMHKLFNSNISTEEVLKRADNLTQQMQMSGPLAQRQKVDASLQKNAQQTSEKVSEEENLSTSAAKKITPKPPGFNN